MAQPRIVSIDLTHLVEAALRREHQWDGGRGEDDRNSGEDPDPRAAGIR